LQYVEGAGGFGHAALFGGGGKVGDLLEREADHGANKKFSFETV